MYTGYIIGKQNELSHNQVEELLNTKRNLGN